MSRPLRVERSRRLRPRRRADGRHLVRARGLARFRPQRARGAAARAASTRIAVDGIPDAGGRAHRSRRRRFDRVFNILHGNRGGGEDGVAAGPARSARRAVHRLRRARLGAVAWTRSAPSRSGSSLGLPTPRTSRLRARRRRRRGRARARPAGDRQAAVRRLERRRHARASRTRTWTPPWRSPRATTARCWSSS